VANPESEKPTAVLELAPRGHRWEAVLRGTPTPSVVYSTRSGIYSTREEAIAAAVASIRRMGGFGEVVILRADGTVEARYPLGEGGSSRLEDDFEADLDYLIEKNAELYQRLAQ
jgi:hypothetical protein